MPFKLSETKQLETTISNRSRPCKDFSESSVRSRRRKIKNIVQQEPLDVLVEATTSALHGKGLPSAAKLIKKTVSSPTKSPIKIIKTQKNRKTFPQ